MHQAGAGFTASAAAIQQAGPVVRRSFVIPMSMGADGAQFKAIKTRHIYKKVQAKGDCHWRREIMRAAAGRSGTHGDTLSWIGGLQADPQPPRPIWAKAYPGRMRPTRSHSSDLQTRGVDGAHLARAMGAPLTAVLAALFGEGDLDPRPTG